MYKYNKYKTKYLILKEKKINSSFKIGGVHHDELLQKISEVIINNKTIEEIDINITENIFDELIIKLFEDYDLLNKFNNKSNKIDYYNIDNINEYRFLCYGTKNTMYKIWNFDKLINELEKFANSNNKCMELNMKFVYRNENENNYNIDVLLRLYDFSYTAENVNNYIYKIIEIKKNYDDIITIQDDILLFLSIYKNKLNRMHNFFIKTFLNRKIYDYINYLISAHKYPYLKDFNITIPSSEYKILLSNIEELELCNYDPEYDIDKERVREQEQEQESEQIQDQQYKFIYCKHFFYIKYNLPSIFLLNIYSDTTYKIWFDLKKEIDTTIENPYIYLINQCIEISKFRDLNWSQMKFFQNGEPYNIIIYLNNSIDLNDLKLLNFNNIFEKYTKIENIYMGFSDRANSEIIHTYNRH